MTLDEFESSITRSAPPPWQPPALVALWHAARGEWDVAHRIVQAESGADAAWVHAYLHREEGDLANAGYWYRRAGRPADDGALAEEWRAIASALLGAEAANANTD